MRYRAGADTGFLIENQAELDEFILKSAATADERTANEVTPYTGELADNLSYKQV